MLDPSNYYRTSGILLYYIFSDSLLPGDAVTLTSDLASPQSTAVGPIALTADVENGTGAGLLYKFTATEYYTKEVAALGENLNAAGYQDATTVNWTPATSGRYTLRVDVLDPSNYYRATGILVFYINNDG